ncbi:MAG: hypothetical protein IJ733_00480, partial [Lachnospiraceae bacterium]|nr:hypothetical protein [Lachnospiraceae bacterium]
MDYIGKKEKRQIIICSMAFLVLFSSCAAFLYIRGIEHLKPIYVFNIGIDLLGMLMAYVLFICCVIDVQKTGQDLRHLLQLLTVAFGGLFFDACAWLLDGVPSIRMLNLIDNT